MMSNVINQYSYLFLTIPVTLVILYFLLRRPGSLRKQILALLLLVVVAGILFLAEPGGSALSGAAAETALFEAGRPSLVEVYSNY